MQVVDDHLGEELNTANLQSITDIPEHEVGNRDRGSRCYHPPAERL